MILARLAKAEDLFSKVKVLPLENESKITDKQKTVD